MGFRVWGLGFRVSMCQDWSKELRTRVGHVVEGVGLRPKL